MMRPTQVGFELTKACNYQCKHCFSRAGYPLSHELSLENVQHILDEIYDIGALFINVTGGEPVLRPDIIEILEYTMNFGEAQIYHFQTNGTAWTDDFLDQFLRICSKQPAIDVQISIDGYDRASYAEARGGPPENFDRIVSLIKTLRNHDIEVNTLMTITKSTLPFAVKTARFAAEELKVNQFLMIPLFPAGRAVPYYGEVMFSRELWKDFLVAMTRIKKDQAWGPYTQKVEVGFFTLYDFVLPLEEAGLKNEIESIWKFNEEEFQQDAKRPTICESGYTDLFINAQGIVFPCTPSIDSDFVAGNALAESLSSIWEDSPIINWFRNGATDVCQNEPCKSCTHKTVCGGGCRLSALSLTGDRNSLDPACPVVAAHMEGS